MLVAVFVVVQSDNVVEQ